MKNKLKSQIERLPSCISHSTHPVQWRLLYAPFQNTWTFSNFKESFFSITFKALCEWNTKRAEYSCFRQTVLLWIYSKQTQNQFRKFPIASESLKREMQYFVELLFYVPHMACKNKQKSDNCYILFFIHTSYLIRITTLIQYAI